MTKRFEISKMAIKGTVGGVVGFVGSLLGIAVFGGFLDATEAAELKELVGTLGLSLAGTIAAGVALFEAARNTLKHTDNPLGSAGKYLGSLLLVGAVLPMALTGCITIPFDAMGGKTTKQKVIIVDSSGGAADPSFGPQKGQATETAEMVAAKAKQQYTSIEAEFRFAAGTTADEQMGVFYDWAEKQMGFNKDGTVDTTVQAEGLMARDRAQVELAGMAENIAIQSIAAGTEFLKVSAPGLLAANAPGIIDLLGSGNVGGALEFMQQLLRTFEGNRTPAAGATPATP